MTKLAVTRELIGKFLCPSYLTHQKVISYSWILAITWAYSPLKSTSSTTVFNRQKTVVELVNFTCELPNSLQDPPLAASLCRLVVIHSIASYVIRHGRKSIACHYWIFLSHANFGRVTQVTRGSRAQVVGRSLIGRKASQVSRRSVARVSWRSRRGCGSGTRFNAHRLMNGVRGSRARKFVMVRSQVTLITWPIIHFLFTLMSIASRHRCKR